VKTIRTPAELERDSHKVCLAIGVFDGVHLGHQQILRQTIADAHQHESRSVVLTFDRHPNTVVAPARVPPMIYSLTQKLRTLESLGVEALLLLHFDEAFSLQTGDDFVRGLVRDLGPIQSICVGANFSFGHKRSGNVDVLRRLGAELQFTVHGLSSVALDGRPVSSTRIRTAIQAGDFYAAGQMLGRPYATAGMVMRGDGLGRQLGFPTANLDTQGLVLPPRGVYGAHVETGGRTHRAVVNLGLRPTLGNPATGLRLEAHLLDFQGELYGQELELVWLEKLRDEQKFASLEALREQIARDIEASKRWS
jgi:riboflavin kinase/FMN adenylyltransferase